MEILISFILSLFMALFGAGEVWPEANTDINPVSNAEVIRVIDGDTIVVSIAGQEETVRYIGIDTPEPYRDGEPACYSQEATARNVQLVQGQQVRLESDQEDRDKYDRLLRYVYVDEMFINQQLVAEGYATTLRIKPNTTQAQELQAAQDAARQQNLGLWSECYADAPTEQVEVRLTDQTAPMVIDTTTLPSGQQKVLNTLGVDESNITITPAVVACAQAAIGADRVAAIVAGDTPGFLEGVKLANCYSSN